MACIIENYLKSDRASIDNPTSISVVKKASETTSIITPVPEGSPLDMGDVSIFVGNKAIQLVGHLPVNDWKYKDEFSCTGQSVVSGMAITSQSNKLDTLAQTLVISSSAFGKFAMCSSTCMAITLSK